MIYDIAILLKLTSLFLILFGIAELLYRVLKVQAEYTRKLVHVGTGLLTLLFPVYFQYLWQVVAICLSFLLLLVISLRFRFLPSINAVSRRTDGSLLYPIIVIMSFAFYRYMGNRQMAFTQYTYFALPVLVMAVSDPLAALAGNAYKKRKGLTKGKTRTGSVVFFISAFVLSFMWLWLNAVAQVNTLILLLYAVAIAFCTACAEYFSGRGWDNFTIPLAVIFLLYFSTVLL